MATVDITDNTGQVLASMKAQVDRALEIIGGKMESYAKGLVAPLGPKGNPMRSDITAQLRNSITHMVEGDVLAVGSNLDMAAYVELGTSKEYSPPPEWIESQVKQGSHSGMDKWFFYDEEQGKVRIGLPMKPTPFLRPALEDHKDEYQRVVEGELKNG